MTSPPEDVYEAVARAQAERSGFRSAKNIERLTAQIAAGADFRAAVDSAYSAGVAAGRAQAAADAGPAVWGGNARRAGTCVLNVVAIAMIDPLRVVSPMADDLRAKIAEMFACRCDPAWTERQLHAPDCVEELGDEVLEAVADWLRELAEMRNSSWLPVDPYAFDDPRDVVGRALASLADRLTQPSTEEKPT